MISDSPWRFNGKEYDAETGNYYYGARYYDPKTSIWLSVDPLASERSWVSPYNFVENNPINRIDPDGRDWYEVTNEETGKTEIKWTDYSSQDQMNENSLAGTYLGEAVVSFERNYNERIGDDGTLTGEGAVAAQATVYGTRGADDIKTYEGLTMSSDPDRYTVIAEGDYKMFFQDMNSSPYGTKGARDWPAALTYRVQTLDGSLNIPTQGGEHNSVTGGAYKTAIFFHRTNWSGDAQRSSEGCLNIDGRQWRSVEAQLGKASNIRLRVRSK